MNKDTTYDVCSNGPLRRQGDLPEEHPHLCLELQMAQSTPAAIQAHMVSRPHKCTKVCDVPIKRQQDFPMDNYQSL